MKREKKIFFASPGGMCSGVRRALTLVEEILQRSGGERIYVYNEIVHNAYLVERLKARNVVFVHDIAEVPDCSTLIFSAHGVARSVETAAAAKHLNIIDATCPLVRKIHLDAADFERRSYEIILLGHAGHPETQGTVGQLQNGVLGIVEDAGSIEALPDRPGDTKIVYFSQTTLNVDTVEELGKLLKAKYPSVCNGGGLCFATRERQDAVKKLSAEVDIFIIIGSKNSSNSNRLREIAAGYGSPLGAFLVDDPAELPFEALEKAEKIGIGAGASAPEEQCGAIVEKIKTYF